MAIFSISVVIPGARLATIQEKADQLFGKDNYSVQRVKRVTSRADRLSEAESDVDNAKSTIVELKEELQEWLDNLPENLQQSQKADDLQSAIDVLDQLETDLDQCDWSVEFPGMY